MKNLMLLAIVALSLLAGCTKENPQTEPTNQTLANEQTPEWFKAHIDEVRLKLRSKVGDPSKGSQNPAVEDRASCNRVPICHNGNSIVVNKSAVPAHMAHGDQLTCCATSCLNDAELLLNGGPYGWYYDPSENDCFGHGEGEIVAIQGSEESNYLFITVEKYYSPSRGGFIYPIWIADDYEVFCDYLATVAEYECAKAYLKSVIAANSCIPNLCDL